MIDSFVLLTPILMLGVIALLGFVGCDLIFTLKEPLPPPANFRAIPGNEQVSLSWDPYSGAIEYLVKRGEASGVYTNTQQVFPPDTSRADPGLTNGVTYFYVITAKTSDDETQRSPEVSATPISSFVTSKTLGTPRNAFTAFLGMAIQVGPSPLTIVTLGRVFVPGNSQIHVVKIVDGTTGADIPGGLASVNMANGTVAGDFVYASLASPVTLNANTSYFVVSQETMGQDEFHDNNTTIQTSSVAITTGSIFGTGGTSYNVDGPAGRTYGPVDFQYSSPV
ncbi:MAG: fibronectin type III domain-containing protein [Gemmatimonadaceae bacterium]|nr:fibronectin type III domain-containing protein [Gemmatimonadaceae bacterium]